MLNTTDSLIIFIAPHSSTSDDAFQGNCQGTERLHTWPEFYADGAWYLADITNKIFGKENEN